MRRIPFPWEGNPLYPLPADYAELTLDGQRQARVCACRQWLVPRQEMPAHPFLSPLQLTGEAAASSHYFFDHFYLRPDPESDFDPYYYDVPPLPTPDFHLDLVRMWQMYRQGIGLAPRGGAKTTVCSTDILKRIITAPAYSMVYATLVHTSALLRSEKIRDQCYNNSRLNDDFGPEYGGPLRPHKHENSTGVERFFLRNKSWFQPISVEGRQRGMRPRRYRLDDPEHDEKASTSMVNIRENMDRLINRVIGPMVLQYGRGVDWTFTHVSKRHYAWHVMAVDMTPSGPVARDPRFGFWARYEIRQLRNNPETGKPESCWPHMWPLDSEERERLGLPDDTPTIAEVRERLGERAWLAEYQGQPGDSEERCFPLIAEKPDDFSFRFSEVDEPLQDDPWSSSATIHFRTKTSDAITENSVPLRELLRRGNLFACSDYSYTSGPASDSKTCVVMLHDPITNVLFVLDLWAAQCGKDKAIRECFTLCSRWRVPVLYIEAIKGSITFYNEMVDIVRTKGPSHFGLSHFPAIKPLKPGTEEKTQKIESLSFRFLHLLIKFPLFSRDSNPPLRQLLAQIEGFNPESANGGLEHDDLIDTVAMSKFVLKLRRTKVTSDTPLHQRPLVQRLLAGEVHDARGVPLGLGIDPTRIPLSTAFALIDSRESQEKTRASRV
jgi:hypothetical protein